MTIRRLRYFVDTEIVATAALITAALVIGFMTFRDYGITNDEFLYDEYGPKALAWYLSGFTDRSLFYHVDNWLYGPWFQMLTASVQYFNLADRFEIRHAMTFLVGLGGLVALLPIGRLTFGRWSGFTAIALCLMTGNFYGHLFFTPNDVPFMAAMTWATLAIIVMAERNVPSWPATICAGLLTGLAIATRAGGILTHVYLLAATALCVLEIIVSGGSDAMRRLLQIGARTASAILLAWITAIALWPWLQFQVPNAVPWLHVPDLPDPASRFIYALNHFINIWIDYKINYWGQELHVGALPRTYLLGELFARLPEGFIFLLAVAFVFGATSVFAFITSCIIEIRKNSRGGFGASALRFARARGNLVLVIAAIAPIAFFMIRRPTIYNGVRHFMFIIPLLAILAGGGLLQLTPVIRRFAVTSAVIASAHVAATIATMAILHPLEYVATNAFAGGTRWSAGRFELDYMTQAATVALRRLEHRLAYDSRFASHTPSIAICYPTRENFVSPMLRRPWILEQNPQKADFIIEAETQQFTYCANGINGVLIDEVKRFDRTFASIFENRPRTTD